MKSKRIRVETKYQEIASWDEADQALAQIAVFKSQIEREEADYNEREQMARAEMTGKHAPIRQRIEALSTGLQAFCREHRDEFGTRKSRELQHGTVSFRVGNPKVEKSKKLTWEGVLDLVKESRFAKLFVRTKDELNREAVLQAFAVREIDDANLAAIGLSVTQEEAFGYELHLAAKE